MNALPIIHPKLIVIDPSEDFLVGTPMKLHDTNKNSNTNTNGKNATKRQDKTRSKRKSKGKKT